MTTDNDSFDDALAKPSNLAALVDYQPHSVVSRTLIQKRTGTVTLFAFDAGESLSEHTAPFDAMVQIIDGKGEFTVGGQATPLGKGEILVMPAGVPHAVQASERFKMLLTMIRS